MRKETCYEWHTGKLTRPVTLLVVTDLHDSPYEDILPMLQGADALLVAGDVANRYRESFSTGMRFLAEAAERLPTFFSIGNHEARLKTFDAFREALRDTRVHLLFNTYACWGELVLGGWYRPAFFDMPDMMEDFEHEPGCKVLLCHRPEDYMKRLRGRDVDLVLAGHAHGGQIRVFGRGLYAPGQGLLPKYTAGVVDERMIVCTGASNPHWLPRWGNPCEVLRIRLD